MAIDTSTGVLWVAYADTNTVAGLLMNGQSALLIDEVVAGLSAPTRLAFKGSTLYVTNLTGNTVTVHDLTQVSSYSIAPTQTVTGLHRPLGVAVDPQGDFFVADNQTSDIAGFKAPYVSLGVKTADNMGHQFWAPGAVAINGQYVYVATNDGSVHSYLTSDFLLSYTGYWLRTGGHVPPYPPKEVNTYQDSASGGPTGIAFDAQGNVYVSYYYSSDVVKYSASGTKLSTISNGISQPEGIAVDGSGNLYVANTGTHDITKFSPSQAPLGTITVTCGISY
jgi:sugar lactone lactonase YvrE